MIFPLSEIRKRQIFACKIIWQLNVRLPINELSRISNICVYRQYMHIFNQIFINLREKKN